MTVISEKAFLILLAVGMSVVSVIFLALAINGFIEYNLGINIFTSLLTTVITIIFLSLFLIIREEREWKIVKKNAYGMIGMELGLLFLELLRFTENEIEEFSFESSLLYTKDSKIRKKIIFSKLSELQKEEPLQLTPSSVSMFRSDRKLLEFLSDTKRNLGDVQIRYERYLTSKITERLIRVQGLLELMNRTYELDTMWNKLQNQLPLLKELMRKLMPEIHDKNVSFTDLIQSVLPTCIKSLIQETYELWKMGIEFDYA